jgi:UDP-glucose 4-epimerase
VNTKVLVTGGCGAIGVNLVRELVESGNLDIFVIDNLSSGNNELPKSVNFSLIDISNKEKMDHYFSGFQPEYIFHLAAHFANQNSVDHPVSDVSTNICGLINLFETQRNNEKLKKIVYASSSCVYGAAPEMKEDVCVGPYDTPYAINKYIGELYCKYYSEIRGVPNVCARIFNNFGPGEMPGPYRNVIPNFIQQALLDEDIYITGTGDETRDFCYVDNTVDLLMRLAFSDFSGGEIFNSGTGEGLSIRELAEAIIEISESKSRIVYIESRSWDHIKHRKANIENSRLLLDYLPKSDTYSELRDTIQWVRNELSR